MKYDFQVSVFSLLACIILTSCTITGNTIKQPTNEDILSVLKNSKDYKDYSSDFITYRGKAFEPQIIEILRLDDKIITERITKLESNPSTSAFALIYKDLPKRNNLIFIQATDKTLTERGVAAVIDPETGETLRFYATIIMFQ